MQDGMPLGEGAALAVLSGEANGVVFREQGSPCQGFRHCPVQRAVFPEGFTAAERKRFSRVGWGVKFSGSSVRMSPMRRKRSGLMPVRTLRRGMGIHPHPAR